MFAKNSISQQNPFSKIKVDFEVYNSAKGLRFSLHFKINQFEDATIKAANQLLNLLLTSDWKQGIFSKASRKNKFPGEKDLGTYLSSDFEFIGDQERASTGIIDNLQSKGTATISFGAIPRDNAFESPYPFFIMLSMLDDGIFLMKKMGCEMHFTMLDVMKKIDELNDKIKDKMYEPDCNRFKLASIIKLINNYQMECHEAILLSYCINAIKHLALPYDNPHGYRPINDMDDIFKIIDYITHDIVSDYYSKDVRLSSRIEDFFWKLTLSHRIKWFRSALGEKRGDDNTAYSWLSPEWGFIRDAQFNMIDHNEMIIEPQKSVYTLNSRSHLHSYNSLYAPGKPYHDQFLNHLKALETNANIDFSFNHESNIRHEIQLTNKCSNKLINMKFHFDENYIKDALKTRNNSRFFQPQNTTGLREKLPEEIVKKISSLVSFKIDKRTYSLPEPERGRC